MSYDIALSIAAGLGLAAACGFRIFVPLLVMSVASRAGYMDLAAGFDWLASTPALVTLSTATCLEILAYYVPWVDNLLDTVATPAAVAAGVVATGSQLADVDPWLRWTTAVIGGGGVAAGVQGVTVLGRQLSTFATGGIANPLISTVEMGASLLVAIVAIVMPFVALSAIVLAVFLLLRRIFKQRQAAPLEAAGGMR